MEQTNYKIVYENNGFRILQGPNRRDFGKEVNRVDSVFYIETDGPVRYAKFDPIKMLSFLFVNMVYEGEREKVRQMLRKEFNL